MLVIRTPFRKVQGENMNKEFKIDYIQFSAERLPLWLVNENEDFRKKSNMAFYTHRTRFLNGAVMYEGNPNTDKKLFVLSGSVCDHFKVSPAWLKSIIDDDGTVSRIDFAMTTDLNILDLLQRDHKSIQSKMFTDVKIISDAEYTPQTIYCGDMKKRAKKGIVRAYDKGLQLGVDLAMYRIELELRQKHANIASKRYAHGESIPSIMNTKFKIDREWYMDIFGNDESTMRFADRGEDEIPEIDRKMLWLESQVIPSIQYVIDYDKEHGTDNFARLYRKLVI